MKRTFCDFCDALLEDYNGAANFDQETRFKDRKVIVRLDLRNEKDKRDSHTGISRPDLCFDCRNAIVAQVFGLTVAPDPQEKETV